MISERVAKREVGATPCLGFCIFILDFVQETESKKSWLKTKKPTLSWNGENAPAVQSPRGETLYLTSTDYRRISRQGKEDCARAKRPGVTL